MTRYSWDLKAMRPARPLPKIGRLTTVGTGPLTKAKGVPAREGSTLTELSTLFRGGDIYAYSWDGRNKVWEVWRTEADWLATERNGAVARPDFAAQGHGPEAYTPSAPVAPSRSSSGKATKAELVAMLRAVVDGTEWEVTDLESLLARV